MDEFKIYKLFSKIYEGWRLAINNDNQYPGIAFVSDDNKEFIPVSDSKDLNPFDKLKEIVSEEIDFSKGTLYVAGDITDEVFNRIKEMNFKNVIYYSDEDFENSDNEINFVKMIKILGDLNKDREWWTHRFYAKAYDKFKNGKRRMPVLIPSYNRPDNVTVKTIFNEMNDEYYWDVYLVVRQSQLEDYKKFNDRFNKIQYLSFPDEQIDNLGAVRRTIVDWLNENNYEFGFMFDDDITELTYTFKGYTGAGELKAKYLHRKATDIPKVLAMWQLSMEYGIKNFDLAASSISPMFSSWKYEYTNPDQSLSLYRGAPSQVMCINAKKFKEEGLVYPDTKDCAHEDIDMAIRIVEKKLKIAMFTFLVYSANPMTPEFGNFGDTMEKRMKAQQEIMYRNHHDKDYVRFQDKRGLAQVSINWIRVRKNLGVEKFRFNLWNDGEILKDV